MAAHNESITFQTTDHAKTLVKDLTKRLGMKQTVFLERLLEWFGKQTDEVREWVVRRNPSKRERELLLTALSDVEKSLKDGRVILLLPADAYAGLESLANRATPPLSVEQYLTDMGRAKVASSSTNLPGSHGPGAAPQGGGSAPAPREETHNGAPQ